MDTSSKQSRKLQMSKVLLVLRNGADARYILNELDRFDDILVKIVLESGRSARKKKLKRMMKGSFFHKLYVVFLQIPLLIIYDRTQSVLMFRDYIPSKPHSDFEFFRIDDVNEEEFITFVEEFGPKKVLSYGTAIYNSATLKQIRSPILNLHTGILPEYRNVHTDFWAYVNNDLAGMGVTIFQLTDKIDDGPIVGEVRCKVTDDDNLWNIKRKNLSAVLELIQNSIQEIETPKSHLHFNEKVFVNQNQGNQLWPTPSAWDLMRYLKLEISKNLQRKLRL